MGGREHLVGIMPHEQGMVLIILRYGNEVRDLQPYFESLSVADKGEAVSLAVDLIKALSGPFQPYTMPDKYAEGRRGTGKSKTRTAGTLD